MLINACMKNSYYIQCTKSIGSGTRFYDFISNANDPRGSLILHVELFQFEINIDEEDFMSKFLDKGPDSLKILN